MVQSVTPNVGDSRKWDGEIRWGDSRNPLSQVNVVQKHTRYFYSQPVDLLVMSEVKDELVYNTIHTNGATDQFQVCTIGIIPDEIVPVKGC
jgi:hypothetical protein